MRRLLALVVVALALPAAPVSAQESPAGCTASGLNVSTSWNPRVVRPGLASSLSLEVSQSGAGRCDVSGVTITVALPGPDGLPVATPEVVVDEANYPAGMEPLPLPARAYTVAVNPGVALARARVTMTGTLQDVLRTPLVFVREHALQIIEPKLGLAVTADPPTGTAPLDVTYRFALTNEGPAPADPLSSVQIAHPNCTPVIQDGDGNQDGKIGAGETWIYTCTYRFDGPLEYTSTTSAAAISDADGRPVTADDVNMTVRVSPGPARGNLTLTTVADPASGFAPLSVAYTYTVRNGGTGPVRDVTVTDAGCSPVTTTTGTAPLGTGESRAFTCSRLFGTVGTFTTGAIANGVDVASGRGVSSDETKTEVATTATPAATVVPTASPAPPPAATPTPTVRPSTRVSFTASGRFARPCRGRIALTVKAGTKTIARKSARPSRTCRYRVQFTVARSAVGKATRVTVTARLGKRTKTQRLAVPR